MRNVENNGMHLVNDRLDYEEQANLEYMIGHVYNYSLDSLEALFDELGLSYEKEKSYPDLYVIKRLRYDYYIEELNLLIEADDSLHYYNRNEQHLRDKKYRDIMKNNYAEDRGIHLMRFPYWLSIHDIRRRLETFMQQYYEQHIDKDQYYFIKNIFDQFKSYNYVEMNQAYELYLKKCDDLYLRDEDRIDDYNDFKDYVIEQFKFKYQETIYRNGKFYEIYSILSNKDYCKLYKHDKQLFNTNRVFEFIYDEIVFDLRDQYTIYELYDLYLEYMRIHFSHVDDLINICEFSIRVTDYMTNLGYERYTAYRDDENDKCQFVFKKMNYKRYEFISKVYDDVKHLVYHKQNNNIYKISLESVFNLLENKHDLHKIYELVRSQKNFEYLDSRMPEEEYMNQVKISRLKRRYGLTHYRYAYKIDPSEDEE